MAACARSRSASGPASCRLRHVRQVGKLGCLKPSAFADLLVVGGDPLKGLGVLQEQGEYLAVIMKGGRFHKNRLS
jgi:imidazolonepropionase-like amidohydrolase